MKLEAGKYYKTRHGRKAYVAFIHPQEQVDSEFSVYGSVGRAVRTWMPDGRYSPWVMCDNLDLVSEWREPIRVSGWVNVYHTGVAPHILYLKKEDADRYSNPNERIACVHVEGAFLGDWELD